VKVTRVTPAPDRYLERRYGRFLPDTNPILDMPLADARVWPSALYKSIATATCIWRSALTPPALVSGGCVRHHATPRDFRSRQVAERHASPPFQCGLPTGVELLEWQDAKRDTRPISRAIGSSVRSRRQ
jgi:hypothetical protein